MTNKNAYAQSGVDVEAGYEVVERIKKHVARTERAGVMGALGGFGGMFDLSKIGVKEPVLISGTDGVGTKLLLAIKYDKHDTIGQDCVAMCVNDIIAAGAEPLYFLDYVATGKNEPAKLEQVVAGVAEGCVQAGAALIGGETAEMPGMYGEDDYDLAGFAVGIAEKSQIIDGSKVAEGDVLLGLASSGIHSNGYSLVRRVFADYTGEEVLPELEGKKLKDVLLEPTRIYVKAALPLIKEELVNGMNDFCALRQEEGNPNIFLTDFLSEIALLTDQDSDKADDGEKITLMTVHSAKGLEFKNVFVVGLEENLFPSGMVGDSPRALEEERRLFYVAITRAEEHCYLSFAKTRFRYGKMEFGSPSRFLRDIDVHYLQLPHEAGVSRAVDEGAGRFRREIEGGFTRSASPSRAPFGSTSSEQRERPKAQIIAPSVPRNLKKVSTVSPSSGAQATSSTSPSVAGVQAGQMIEHERFGLGEVIKVEGTGDNAKATIHFKNAGDKQLLLRFARFKVVE